MAIVNPPETAPPPLQLDADQIQVLADLEALNRQLVETDEVPLESDWHRMAINLLIEIIRYHFRDRKDFFAGGNMFIYFSTDQARTREFRGPDFFLVKGADRDRLRRWWAVWEENGLYPNVIIELLSPSTAHVDRTTKKQLYEGTFRTSEYYCYNPATNQLEGWRLDQEYRYQPLVPDHRGWLRSEQLDLYLGTWTGRFLEAQAVWLRFFDPEGRLVPTYAEAAQSQATAAETRAAEAETRAETAEAEAERLRQELEALRRGSAGQS